MRLIYFIIFSIILSCNDQKKILPNSTGSNSEILFVASDYIWDEKIKNVVFDIFCDNVPGISKPESNFKVLQINTKELSSLLKTHTNIVLLSTDSITSFKNNFWATNQLVTQLSFTGDINQFQNDCSSIYKVYYDKEINFIKNQQKLISNKNYSKEIFEIFGIDIIIPKKYTKVIDSKNSLIFSYSPETSDEIKHIMVYSLPDKNTDKEMIIEKTNKILSQNLLGPKNSYVIIEERYPIELYNNSYRGLWKLNKGYMGGPILIKPFFTDNNLVLVCALVFDPGNAKRNHIKEFESIL